MSTPVAEPSVASPSPSPSPSPGPAIAEGGKYVYEEVSNRYVADIHDTLRPIALASRSNKPIGDRMIMNAAFLVERAHEKEFDDKVREVSHRYEDLLTFKYTGPWPPYNFVNIKLKLEKAN